MSYTPSKLATRTRTIEFPFDGDTLHVTYRPSELNDANGKRIFAIGAELNSGEKTPEEVSALTLEFATIMSQVLVKWAYEEDANADGTPSGVMVPLTPERITAEMERFGDFVAAHMRAAVQDYQQGNASGTTSSGR
jgi:hypothetical protein